MSYLGRSWTSFVLLAAKKSVPQSCGIIVVEANPVKTFQRRKRKRIGQERLATKD